MPAAAALAGGALAHWFLEPQFSSIWTHWSVIAVSIFALTMLILDCCRPIKERHEAREFGAGATQRIAGPTPPPYPNGWYVVFAPHNAQQELYR